MNLRAPGPGTPSQVSAHARLQIRLGRPLAPTLRRMAASGSLDDDPVGGPGLGHRLHSGPPFRDLAGLHVVAPALHWRPLA